MYRQGVVPDMTAVDITVSRTTVASLEEPSSPLLGPSDTLSNGPLRHINIHPSRVLHQKEHSTVAGKEDDQEEIETAVAYDEGICRQHHQRLAPLPYKCRLSHHCEGHFVASLGVGLGVGQERNELKGYLEDWVGLLIQVLLWLGSVWWSLHPIHQGLQQRRGIQPT